MELVVDHENGLLFEPNDAAALARAMQGFAALDDGERRAMRAAAGQTARLADWGWIGRKVATRLHGLLATA
jgi:glycosyltransferase involved in cell wall biosynthesis